MKKPVLIIMSCSATKRAVTKPTPFIEVYDGPIWKQVRNNYTPDSVAVVSAKHGVLYPGENIDSYDDEMTEDRLVEICNDPGAIASLVDLISRYERVVVLGGELYKLLALFVVSRNPEVCGKVHFVCGSYLKQRKALRIFLDQASALA